MHTLWLANISFLSRPTVTIRKASPFDGQKCIQYASFTSFRMPKRLDVHSSCVTSSNWSVCFVGNERKEISPALHMVTIIRYIFLLYLGVGKCHHRF